MIAIRYEQLRNLLRKWAPMSSNATAKQLDTQSYEQARSTTLKEVESAPKKKAQKGRPRSEKSRQAIIKATNNLLLRMSVQELSIEAIAKKAKVGKTTIYRWWPNKTAVVMDALINQPGMQTPLPTAQNNVDAVRMQLEKLIRLLDSSNGETISQLFSESQASPEAKAIFENNFIGPLLDAIEYSIQQGQKTGEFKNTLDSKTATDIACGPLFFRLMAHSGDFNEAFQASYTDDVLKLLTTQ